MLIRTQYVFCNEELFLLPLNYVSNYNADKNAIRIRAMMKNSFISCIIEMIALIPFLTNTKFLDQSPQFASLIKLAIWSLICSCKSSTSIS